VEVERNDDMAADWNELIGLTGSRPIVVERVRVVGTETRIEGEFSLPTLATLGAEDQVFVAAFIRSHGSIKRMEQLFGISYPTVKNRLNRIGNMLDFVDITPEPERDTAPSGPTSNDVLRRIDSGQLDVDQAIRILRGGSSVEREEP
jgi:hypothetical protein